jgi:hypothetical protein
MKTIRIHLLIITGLLLANQLFAQKIEVAEFKNLSDEITAHFKGRAYVTGKLAITSAEITKKVLYINFSSTLSEYSLSDADVVYIYDLIETFTKERYSHSKCVASVGDVKIQDLVVPDKAPGYKINKKIKKMKKGGDFIFKTNESNLSRPDKGLQNKNIALWQSHGLYYEQKLFRWEWQRARLFQTVEDLYTQSYVLPFLVPMLENAGANVFLPRERDTQDAEVIVDNDNPQSGFEVKEGKNSWSTSLGTGFAKTKDIYLTGENPFEAGTTLLSGTVKNENPSYAYWKPDFPKTGEYAVYISYKSFPNSSQKAQYTVNHSGGSTLFSINQRAGGSTWIYLGTFRFDKGKKDSQFVSLSNVSEGKNDVVSADAVKFGGGMGNIARKPNTEGMQDNRKSSSTEPIQYFKHEIDPDPEISGYPRFTEGARYWLQWAGFSDTIYSSTKNSNDYNDDYMSRGRWVNVLSGGSYVNPDEKGYGIPIDMSMAFHTDAGTNLNDSIVGTLGIYTRNSNGVFQFPSGEPRLHSRYLTELIQTQIVNDVKKQYEPIWQRRGIWDKTYAESRTPKVPAMLLELLSHQNLADMRYGLDPNFRFTVSRAIYKGILRYFSLMNNTPYVVQPLPVRAFTANTAANKVILKWQPVSDSLEPSAIPDRYIIYTKTDSSGFDNGVLVTSNEYTAHIEYGKIYSFKVTAVNAGGESFPSETLSVYNSATGKGKVLIVNGFTKISAPASYATKDTLWGGFLNSVDQGVPYIKDISFIGFQYDFRRKIPWNDDDAAGFGSSYSDYAKMVVAGNTFDYPYYHGIALAKSGYSFISCSRESFENGEYPADDIIMADIIMGKQLKTIVGRGVIPVRYEVFTEKMRKEIESITGKGINILVSGANIGTDIWDSSAKDTTGENFTKNILHFSWRTNNASNTGEIKGAPNPYNFSGNFSFFREPNGIKYNVEAPDGIEPADKSTWTIMRYRDNNVSAGVAYKGEKYRCVALGFPIESLKDQSQINFMIENIVRFLGK